MAELLSLAEAHTRVLEHVRPLDAEAVKVEAAAGRFAAEDVRARVDLPPFPSSAMDGYAVRADDTPGRLPVVDRIAAGMPAPRALDVGEAMAIATGGVVPDGADSVIPVELVVEGDNSIEIAERVVLMANVRPRGGDLRADDVVVAKGSRLGPAQIGAIAAAGVEGVSCGRRPRVAVLSTGTELRRAGEPLGPGQVYEANAAMVAAALSASGADVVELPSVADDPASHRDALTHALDADVVVTSGGVSVGPHDLVRRELGGLGVDEVFWGVAVKPGKPVYFGVRERTLVFGLPGNPVSSLVGCELFVRPAVHALQGAALPGPTYETGALATSVRRNAHRDQLLRARRSVNAYGVTLEPVGGQESHMIARAAAADSLVLVEQGEGELPSGAPVRYLRLG